jgi:site-specific DNA-cytosine methylase
VTILERVVMRYLSLFTGIGGLEDAAQPPELCCEIDAACAEVLRRRFPGVPIHHDVSTLHPDPVDIVAGGWPCQDLSIAGAQLGLDGARSGLFFQLLRVAKEAKAHTIVAENVPNLLRMDETRTFREVLARLQEAGFPFVGWRLLNAREFGLPQERRRVLLVASKERDLAFSILRPLEESNDRSLIAKPIASGFYWTAGIQSLCYSIGYAPALKVGSALSIPSPPAVHFGSTVRMLRPSEALSLQGFRDPTPFEDLRPADVYRMAGNAVAAPVGRFAFESVMQSRTPAWQEMRSSFDIVRDNGLLEAGMIYSVDVQRGPLATNLECCLDLGDTRQLSQRAASGLLSRLNKSGKPAPADLVEMLNTISMSQAQSQDRGAPDT